MEGSKSSSTTMQVSFVCQRCCQPLKLDTSFNVLDRVTIHELIGMYDYCRCCKMHVTFMRLNVSLTSLVTFKQLHLSWSYPCIPLSSAAPLVTVTPSKQADSTDGESAPEVRMSGCHSVVWTCTNFDAPLSSSLLFRMSKSMQYKMTAWWSVKTNSCTLFGLSSHANLSQLIHHSLSG